MSESNRVALVLAALLAGCVGTAEEPPTAGFDESGRATVMTPKPATTEKQYLYDEATKTTYEHNTNRRIVYGEGATQPISSDGVESLGKSQSPLTTYYGMDNIQLQVVECVQGDYSTGSRSASCSLGGDYVMLGGGASIDYTGPGAMLWESRPLDGSDYGTGSTWVASSKDHYSPDSHRLRVWVFGIQVKRTDGSWMPKSTLKSYVRYRSQWGTPTSGLGTSICPVPAGYLLVGGGGRAEWSGGYGRLLVRSSYYLEGIWRVETKDHLVPNSNATGAYCIGFPTSLPGVAGTFSFWYEGEAQGRATGPLTSYTSLSMGSRSYNIGFGADSRYFSGPGRMLYAIGPKAESGWDLFQGRASSKDHIYASYGEVFAEVYQLVWHP